MQSYNHYKIAMCYKALHPSKFYFYCLIQKHTQSKYLNSLNVISKFILLKTR